MKIPKKKVSPRFRPRQVILMLVLFGFLAGTTVFLLFLGSKSSRLAQKNLVFGDNVNRLIDDIISELEYCAVLDAPFVGSTDHCYYRRVNDGDALQPSMDMRGFLFSEGVLNHVVRNASGGTDLAPFRGVSGALLSGLRQCEFRRIGSRGLALGLVFRGREPDGEPVELKRFVFLRNH
jgi:hypothetical protein